MKKRHIGFWIAFPIGIVLITALTFIYLDLADGPFVLLIIELAAIAVLVVLSILFLNRRMWIRLLPWAGFIATTVFVAGFARPSVAVWPAVETSNPVYTDVLQIEKGRIRGVVSNDGAVEVYAGIPYAAPPVGEYRWQEPHDVTPWEGVKDCSHFAARSMQPSSNPLMDNLVDIYAERSWHPDYFPRPYQNMSEDSLYLNVWKPKGNVSDLPVLVYIHGGSLTNGSSAEDRINGEAMAKQGVIMVTVQYRLGVFGYFAHEDLETESASRLPGGVSTTGNYGLLDQVKAVEWVHDNIAFFGGSPAKVTIAGESAGSSSVSALCVTPLLHGKDYFRYAIGESSSIVSKLPPHTLRTMEEAKKVGNKILKEQGCSSIADLRKVPAEKLVKTAFANSSMTIDGYALDKMPMDTYLAHENNEKALLNGYNVKEADAFIIPQYLLSPTNKGNIKGRLEKLFDVPTAAKIMDLYKENIEKDAFTAFNEIVSVYWFIEPHHRWSELAINNGLPVYRYQFTKENGYYGSFHSGEIIYAYGNIARSRQPFAYDSTDYALSNKMLRYWANFVKSGNPNGESLETWAEYSASKGYVQELGTTVKQSEDKYLALYPIINEFESSKAAA